MSPSNDPVARASAALHRALAPAPDDADHVAPDLLDALVRDTLDAADREWVDAHVASCRQCAEDVEDRREVQTAIDACATGASTRPTTGGWRRRRAVAAVLAAAAGLVLAVAFGRQFTGPAMTPAAALVPNPSAPPVPEAAAEDGLLSAERTVVAAARAAARLELPADAAFLAGEVGTLLGDRGTGTSFGPQSPRGTAVATVRPEFRWEAAPGASAYTVSVFNERFEEIASGRVAGTRWTPGHDLPRAQVLNWQVTAHRREGTLTAPAPPASEARFRVLPTDAAAAMVDARRRLAGNPLSLGILQARHGLVDDAAASFSRAEALPATRELARRLRLSLPGQGAPATTNPAQ